MPVATLDLSKGWMPDIPPFELPEGGLTNTDQILPSVIGYRGLSLDAGTDTTLNYYVTSAREFVDSSTRYWATFDGNNTSRLYGNAVNLSNTSMSQYYGTYGGDYWQFAKYGDWIIASNGYDPVQIYKSTAFQNLGGYPPSAKYVLVYGERLILANLGLALSRGTTTTRVANSYFKYKISGVYYSKTATAAGTALAAGTIPQNKYGLYRFTIDSAGTITCTPAAANFTTGYADEATALAAIPAVPASNAKMGYITVMSTNAAGFVGGTDALKGGTGGNPASFTSYYIDCDTRSDKSLYWSALADIENWTVSVTTGCDLQDMPDLKGVITGIAEIPNGFAIFSDNSIANGYLVANNFVFGFTITERSVGAVANSCIVANHGVFFWSKRDIWFYNGAKPMNLGEGIRYTIRGAVGISTTVIPGTYKNLSVDSQAHITTAHDPEEGIVYWNYTYGAGWPTNSLVVAFSYKLNQFTKFKNYLYATDNTVCTALHYSYNNGNCLILWRYDGTTSTAVYYNANTAGTSGDLTTGEIQLRDEKNFPVISMVQKIRPKPHKWTVAPVITLSSRMDECDTSTDQTVTVDATTGWANVRQSGRYHKIKTTLGGGVIKSIDVEYEIVGKK